MFISTVPNTRTTNTEYGYFGNGRVVKKALSNKFFSQVYDWDTHIDKASQP